MIILICVPLLIILYWYLNYLWSERYLKKFPGPTPLAIFGSVLNFIEPKKVLGQLLKYGEQYNGDYKIYLGFQPVVVLSEIKSVELLLSSSTNLKKAKQYKFLTKWLGNGILLSTGNYWRKHRKIITPAFHFKILEKYVETFNSASDTLVNRLRDMVDQAAFDIYPYIALCMLDVICEATMGICVNAQVNSESKYVTSVKKMGKIVVDRIFSVLQQYDILYQFSENYRTEKKALGVLHGYAYQMIECRKTEFENIFTAEDLSSRRKLAFLDLLLHHHFKNNSLTNEEIREEVDTLLFEGHDTTASGTSFVLYNLATNPDVQEKVYQEVESIFANDPTRTSTYSDLTEMRYLEMVIKESLRLYPSVPLYARELITDIKNGDRVLPKGTVVFVNAMSIHRNPNIYPNPDVFDPERFLPDNCTNRSPYAFIPFSAGPRNCVGQKFATLEMKSTIAKILKHFKVLPAAPAQKLELILEAVMRPNNGILVNLKKR